MYTEIIGLGFARLKYKNKKILKFPQKCAIMNFNMNFLSHRGILVSKKRKISLSTTQIILLSFVLAILLGSLLLALPISSADGKAVPYIDALFAATTATCVTGLVTLPTATTWSVFGNIVILVLIQIG